MPGTASIIDQLFTAGPQGLYAKMDSNAARADVLPSIAKENLMVKHALVQVIVSLSLNVFITL